MGGASGSTACGRSGNTPERRQLEPMNSATVGASLPQASPRANREAQESLGGTHRLLGGQRLRLLGKEVTWLRSALPSKPPPLLRLLSPALLSCQRGGAAACSFHQFKDDRVLKIRLTSSNLQHLPTDPRLIWNRARYASPDPTSPFILQVRKQRPSERVICVLKRSRWDSVP
ncbi:uncharacterized protein LOC144617425 isoform X1 [Panthera onca]